MERAKSIIKAGVVLVLVMVAFCLAFGEENDASEAAFYFHVFCDKVGAIFLVMLAVKVSGSKVNFKCR